MKRKKVRNKEKLEELINVLVLLAIFAFLLSYFKPELLLLDTTTSGGDTASHNYPLHYMRNYLLPNFRLIGWSQDWYAGFPMFQFYFPIPFLLMALLSYVIPINIAFKIGTILGTFLLPVTVFIAGKIMKFKFPIPVIASILTLLFLFNTGNSMWGGNIPSTLAGEFSYSLSLAVVVLFLGLLYAGITNKKSKHNSKIALSILFAFATLCHAYPVFFAAVASTFFLFNNNRQSFIYLFKVYGLAFLLTSFWLVPMFAKLNYSSVYHYIWNFQSSEEVFPDLLKPLLLLATIGGIAYIFRPEKRVLFFFYCLFTAVLLYSIAPHIGVTDIRFVPFFQLLLVFPSAYAITKIIELIDQFIINRWLKRFVPYFTVAIVLISVLYFTSVHHRYIPDWIKWNYSGFEQKQHWSQLEKLTTYLRSLPAGRVVHEYSNSHDKFGTPRTFELIPFFTGKPVLEGLNIESALTAPYVFVIQSEISLTPTCPIPGLRCTSFDVKNATIHLRQFDVRYVIATSSKLKDALKTNENYRLLKSFDEIEVYELIPNERSGYVGVVKYEPVLVQKKEWKKLSLEWFKQASEVPIVFVNSITPTERARFKVIHESVDIGRFPKIPVENCEINESVENEVIELQLADACIGKPLIVRVSYFPNWKVEGADRIYLTSPAFMLIYPKQKNVKIYYVHTIIDYISTILSIIGLIATVTYLLRPLPKFLNRTTNK